MTREDGQQLFTAFFSVFDGLWNMRMKAQQICRNRRTASITLPNGARRVLFGQKLSPSVVLNTTVQGSAAVGMKYGLIEAGRQNLDEYLGAVVHDEAVSCVPDDIALEYGLELQRALIKGMQKVVSNVPIKAELKRMPDGSMPTAWQP
jgi:hypothetical protein